MKKNVGKTDKIVRLTIAIVLITLYLTDVLNGTLGIIALIAAGVAIITAIFNSCGLYNLLGFNTCKIKQ